MKRLFALLLVLCMAVGMIACGNSGTNNPSGDNNSTGGNSNNEKPFAGKELQIWGLAAETYNDINNMGRGSYVWMMRAAIDEWAALNDVTVKFVSNYDQTAIIGQMNSGEKPDLVVYATQFPAIANSGVARPLTDDEYKHLSDICGEKYLDLMIYKGESYGVLYPWSGTQMFYYNETLFENAGVKSPGEYFKEGNWTWETLQTCMKEITMDTDGDGIYDIFGMPLTISWMLPEVQEDLETGKLINIVDGKRGREYLDMLWNGILNGSIVMESQKGAGATELPAPAMHAGDCEPYNYAHLDKTNSLGERIKAIPQPVSTTEPERVTRISQAFMSIPKNCDESEAVLSLMSYILKCGLKYMEDFSVGLFETEFEGIQGASKYSKDWKEIFDMVVAERKTEFAALDFDMELYNKTVAALNEGTQVMGREYAGLQNPWIGSGEYKVIRTTPPASSLAVIKQLMQADIDKYNDQYVN